MSINHYENFPVASVLMPKRPRNDVVNIYRFARTADDIADEGNDSDAERLNKLSTFRKNLNNIENNNLNDLLDPNNSYSYIFKPLAQTIEKHQIPLYLFSDLITAFEQDISIKRYSNDRDLFNYCKKSANPVGRIMLRLFNDDSPENIINSDAICTGLQLTNFWQDIAIDWLKNRVYIPKDKLDLYQIPESYIQSNVARSNPMPFNQNWYSLMQSQVQQARELLISGQDLGRQIPGRIGLELRMVIQGGLRILEKLDNVKYDVFYNRPVIKKSDWLTIFFRSI